VRQNADGRLNVIYTQKANCQDCYRCVRFCPVKAIRIAGGQAQIDASLCVQCGTCVRECPQGAKQIRSDLDAVRALVASETPVAASVAPSFAALYSASLTKRFPGLLRRLGFRYVAETAEGAEYITEKSFAPGETGSICTACPAVVKYAEKYRPEVLRSLIPIVSPMVAHGRLLKRKYKGCAVVFIGPCAAKKEEAARPENADAIDCVLTFQELTRWMEEEGVAPETCSESGFDSVRTVGDARLFPLEGGMLRTGGIASNPEDAAVLRVSGAEAVIALLHNDETLQATKRIEPLFCMDGCIGGPAFPKEKSVFERRGRVIAYWRDAPTGCAADAPQADCRAVFAHQAETLPDVSEMEIRRVYEKTGKADPAHQLNCGACGYPGCRENAIAIVRGMAEPEMCMPYMRRLAQQRTDKIIETTPTGIVLLDSELCMIQMNPAFQKMFTCNNGILGRRVSYLVNADGFEQLQAGGAEKYESVQTKYGIRYHEVLYALREDSQYVGIYTDISQVKFNAGQLDVIKTQTLLHAKEFLEHQVKFAQEMAHYLGKSTAQSEEIAQRLIALYEEQSPEESP
jgi:iron only hydrogenase large subunit-like protein/uncharacterized Fe-S cluster-containing protein